MQPKHLNVAEERFASLVGVGEMVAVMAHGADFQNDKICHSGEPAIESVSQS
jgi:hypothetical protein